MHETQSTILKPCTIKNRSRSYLPIEWNFKLALHILEDYFGFSFLNEYMNEGIKVIRSF